MLFNIPTEYASAQFAKTLSQFLITPLVLTFSGEIGMGKTTIIRFLLQSLGVTSSIKSPTFSLVETYSFTNMQIHHFDLYRIHDESELDYIGFRDYFGDQDICCIEWPERAKYSLKNIDLAFDIVRQREGRDIIINAHSPSGEAILKGLASTL
ncbi:MAG: tRNA (adenosine(37)-N6)-threonylcarbamoyltransferase complex ATPase subunit type 1 TsaE [Legionellales bacterium RIFCSPHIGHO2_12_FULL_35_11]|nr:MAG: tRNA (adenosine(37)-N6)-threonylcarbamoyltransferase complex ATPase subunit type 1 TsaE [Legionellales bacterium RIFCSPHIGHO2_12_FULL_35_11]